MAPTIRVTPTDSMFDYFQLRIVADGLTNGQQVTIACVLKSISDPTDLFVSYAFFKANAAGVVDCSKDASSGGSYKGVDPVGLLWSLVSAPGNRKGAAFMPNNVQQAVEYCFHLIDGHKNADFKTDNGKSSILCSALCRRHLLHPDVSRIDVEAGRVRGTLFLPRKANTMNRCLAIIDLYGTRGGLSEHRAAVIASHGYAALALAYFRHKDLPPALNSGDMEYFVEAVDWLLEQPNIKKDGVAVIGASLGADLGILLSTIDSRIKAVVSVNGYHMLNEMWQFKYKGALLPFIKGMFTEEFLVDGDADMGAFRRSLPDDPECIYPVEKSQAQFLFICGELDRNTDAVHTGAILTERLRDHGKEKQAELIVFPGAGHMMDIPHLPLVSLGYNKSYDSFVHFGGRVTPHAKAQIVAWKKTFEFFKQYLGHPINMRVLGSSNFANSRL